MIDLTAGYDWSSAFEVAMRDSCTWVQGSSKTGAAPPFEVGDVEEVFAAAEGENDGDAWLVFGKLKDGRYFLLTASCDYTGWGCQDGGSAYVAETRELLEQFGLTPEEKIRLFPEVKP